jgi:hypothetical protein
VPGLVGHLTYEAPRAPGQQSKRGAVGPQLDHRHVPAWRLGSHPGQHALPGDLRQERRGRLRVAGLPRLLLRRRLCRDDDADRDDPAVRHGRRGAGAGNWAPAAPSRPCWAPTSSSIRARGSGRGVFPIFLVRIPAWIFLGLWFLYQLIEASFGLFSASANGGGVAFFAHVGGFIFGLLVARLLCPGGTGSTREQWPPWRSPAGSSPQQAKPGARRGDAHRPRIAYSQSCHRLSGVMVDPLRWMLSSDRQAAAAVGL